MFLLEVVRKETIMTVGVVKDSKSLIMAMKRLVETDKGVRVSEGSCLCHD